MAEEILTVSFDDKASAPANVCAESLDRVDKALDELDGKEAKVGTGGLNQAATALQRLRDLSGRAGSAMATALSGVQDHASSASVAVRKLSSVFDLVKNRAEAAKKAEDAAFKAAQQAANRLPTELQPGAAPKAMGGFQQLVGIVNKLFGPNAAGGLVRGAAALSDASDKLGPLGPVLLKGGGAVALGAVALGVAAAALVVGAGVLAAKLLYAGAQFAIAQTTFREKALAGLEAVTKSAGVAKDAYNTAIKLAVDLDLDKETTVKRVKGLLTAGFKNEEIKLIITAVSDITIAKGDEAGQALQKQLEKIKAASKFDAGAIGGLAEAGVQAELVYAALAKQLGTTVDIVKGKVKAGLVSTEDGIKAILAAVQQQAGGAAAKAANNVPGMLGGIKIQIEELFSNVDLGPLKEALATVYKLLDGPDGARLKAAVETLFGTVFKVLFKAFQGPEGEARIKKFLDGAASAMEGAAKIIEAHGPEIERIIVGLADLLNRSGSGTGGSWLQSIAMGLLSISLASYGLDADALIGNFKIFVNYLSSMGSDMIAGLVNGITSGASRVVDALVGTVNAAIAAANKALGRKSPARATIDMGSDTSEGFEVGVLKRLNRVRDAGATMAGMALAGASGAANDNATAGAVPAAAGGGGGNVTIIVQVQAGPGTTREQAQAVGDAASEGAYRAWKRNAGRWAREQEGKAA